jgi:hypothetical protein
MEMRQALNNALGCIQMAEDAAEIAVRERHLKMARKWLKEADSDEWFKRKVFPTVIIALDDK